VASRYNWNTRSDNEALPVFFQVNKFLLVYQCDMTDKCFGRMLKQLNTHCALIFCD